MGNTNDFNDLRLSGFNVDEGITYTGNSEKYIAALQRFLRRSDNTRAVISGILDEQGCEELTATVHALKSNARMIGADRLAQTAETMELHGRLNEYDRMFSYKAEILRLFDEVVSALRPYGELEEVHPASELSAKEAAETGDALIEAVEDYDDEKAVKLIDKLMRYPFRYTLINVLKNAREDLAEYEYNEALLKIRRVVSQIED